MRAQREAGGYRAGLAAALLTLLLLGGCGGLPLLQQPQEAPVHTYLLEWQPAAPAPPPDPAGPTLLVAPVLSAPGFDSADMAYIRTAHEIEYFARHRWVDAPAHMLEPLLVRAAERTGLFRGVAAPGSGVEAELRLDSRLLYLQQVCRLEPSELQLALRVSLVDVPRARIVATRTLRVTEPLEAHTPYAGVQAANRAVARLLDQLQDFLAGQLRARSTAPP